VAAGPTQNTWPNGPSSGPRGRAPQIWVDAAPFRAHVAHLMAAAGLSVEAVALLAGVHTKAVARLIAGQDTGRPAARRIRPELARCLLQVRSSDVRALRCRIVGAHTVTGRVRLLRSSGWSEARLAASLGVDRPSLAGLLEGSVTTCTALVAVRAAAAVLTVGAAGSQDLGVAIGRDVA
jgi:plasmid maintenance system antidote protein VapI